MPDEKFKVPQTSLSEIKRVIEGYSLNDGEVTREEICRLTGVGSTTASSANTFLKEIGLVDGNHKKAATELGRKLGRAIHHDQTKDEQRFWQEAIKGNEFLSSLITTVRIRKGMTSEELATQVLYAAGTNSTTHKRTGANTVVEILKQSNLLEEQDGKLYVATSSTHSENEDTEEQVAESNSNNNRNASNQIEEVSSVNAPAQTQQVAPLVTPTIAVNIQLQLPETENPVVYDNLFKSLRANLLTPQFEENE